LIQEKYSDQFSAASDNALFIASVCRFFRRSSVGIISLIIVFSDNSLYFISSSVVQYLVINDIVVLSLLILSQYFSHIDFQ